MRISTANTYNTAINALENQQSALSDVQNQITTGLRVNKASDDPLAAATGLSAQSQINQIAANQTAASASLNVMTQAESALGSATDLLAQARSALVAAGDGSYKDSDRKALATQLSAIRQQLFTIANQGNGTGGYLFSGQGSSGEPFADTASGVQYQGTSGQLQTNAGQALPMSMDGQAIWMQAPTGNGVFQTSAPTQQGTAWITSGSVYDPSQLTGATYQIQFSTTAAGTTYSVLKNGVATAASNVAYTSGQDIRIDGMSVTISGQPANGDSFQLAPSTNTQSVFAALDSTIKALNTNGLNQGQVAQAVNSGLAAIDSVSNRISLARSVAGNAMTTINALTSRLSSQSLAQTTVQSNAVNVDLASAISALQQKQTGYQAALQTYSVVQHLSLFQYING